VVGWSWCRGLGDGSGAEWIVVVQRDRMSVVQSGGLVVVQRDMVVVGQILNLWCSEWVGSGVER
jgi:hypothetical protein